MKHSNRHKLMSEKEYRLRFEWLYPHFEEAGRRLRLRQRNRNFQISTKDDSSKVTDADQFMSEFWMELITKAFPGETVISEEDNASHRYEPASSIVWYIDPIDGTKKFIEGSPNYFVLVSICINGKPGFGILYQPERNCVLYGNPYIRTRLHTSLHEYRETHQLVSWSKQMPLVVKGAEPALRNRLETVTHLPVRRTSNSAHNIISPLSAPTTGFLSFRKTAYWDLAAPSAIMESAGFRTGVMSRGEPARYNDGNIYCDRYYCLPHDTPEEVIEYVTTLTV